MGIDTTMRKCTNSPTGSSFSFSSVSLTKAFAFQFSIPAMVRKILLLQLTSFDSTFFKLGLRKSTSSFCSHLQTVSAQILGPQKCHQ